LPIAVSLGVGCPIALVARTHLVAKSHALAAAIDESRHELTTQTAAAIEELRSHSLKALLRTVDSAVPATAATVSIISPGRSAEIEGLAHEVWIWAYDLSWDFEGTVFNSPVYENLVERKRYRFLLPNDPSIICRMEGLICRYQDIAELDRVLEARIRKNEVPFARFGFTMYNPTFKRARRHADDSSVVLLPHFSSGAAADIPMVLIQGSLVNDYEREYDQLWQSSDALDVAAILTRCGA
jgi:hypothetical protein